jgi:hypothetical protein
MPMTTISAESIIVFMVDPSDAGFALTVTVSAVVTWLAAILNLHERIENKLFLDRTRKDSNFKRPHIYATLFQIEKCWSSRIPDHRWQ